MPANGQTLETVSAGDTVVIRSIDTSDPQVRRLMTLGLVEGAVLEHATSALGGDPMEFKLFGHGISLRREQARAFTVSKVEAVE